MKTKSGVLGTIAVLALFAAVAVALAQQHDPKQQGSMLQDEQTVRQVQQSLINQGYDPGPVNGKWNAKTESAVKKFQQEQGMSATGQLDQQTLASLGIPGSAAGGPHDMSSQSSQSSRQGGSKY